MARLNNKIRKNLKLVLWILEIFPIEDNQNNWRSEAEDALAGPVSSSVCGGYTLFQ